jgi:hypothetical protein
MSWFSDGETARKYPNPSSRNALMTDHILAGRDGPAQTEKSGKKDDKEGQLKKMPLAT